ncbi:hypothetical protein AB0N38_26135 [Micromonospora aurantiaca]|uniref:hypothetical protein n=1 Tax=Micromonospora aurantiaca (nom. illeg.) TaxID=47850 RepID=UPI00341877BA
MAKGIKTKTATFTYTWIPGSDLCSTEVHATEATCGDCEDNSPCADCGGQVTGPDYLLCVENGEAVHGGCSPQRAADGWDDYF